MDQGASHPNNQYHKAESDPVMWTDGFEEDFVGKGKGRTGGGGGEVGEGDDTSDSKQMAVKKKRLPFVFFKYVLCSSICSVLFYFTRHYYHRYHLIRSSSFVSCIVMYCIVFSCLIVSTIILNTALNTVCILSGFSLHLIPLHIPIYYNSLSVPVTLTD